MNTTTHTIPDGYKQTEAGVIPNDWMSRQLGEECELITKGTTPTSIGENFKNSGISFIKIESLSDSGEIIKDKVAYIDSATNNLLKRSQLKEHDVLVSIAGALGRISIITKDLLPANINQALAIVRLNNKSDLVTSYLYNYLKSNKIQNHIQSISVQGAQANISLQNVNEFPIGIASSKEQLAIASVLSDLDLLIQKTGKLIAKKRVIKQGAMQELLTGRRRLPGFSEKWEVKKLGELLTYDQPTKYLVKSEDYSDNFSIPVLTAGKTFVLGYTNEEVGVFNNLPTIIFDDFTTASKFVDFPFKAKSSAMKMLSPRNKDINLRFLFERMQLINLVLGDHKRYWISEYQNIEINMPESDEQLAIEKCISDMDGEIKFLEQKLEKYNEIKQGAMQVLLTGKIRLIKN